MISRRTWITGGAVVLMGVVVATVLLWPVSEPAQTLRIERQKLENAGVATPSPNVLPDFFRSKYSVARRAEFRLTSSEPIAIYVLATGVEVRADSGWQPISEEPRNEIWRLKPGIAQELFVERPESGAGQTWRAYVRYSTEMKGPRLLKVQLREAWLTRSFTNWSGQAWGGGRFSGANMFSSGEFSE